AAIEIVALINDFDGAAAVTARHVAGQVARRRAFHQKLVAGGIGIVHARRWRMRPDAEDEGPEAVILDIELLDMARRFGAGRSTRAVIDVSEIGPVAEQFALKAKLGAAEIAAAGKIGASGQRAGMVT